MQAWTKTGGRDRYRREGQGQEGGTNTGKGYKDRKEGQGQGEIRTGEWEKDRAETVKGGRDNDGRELNPVYSPTGCSR